MDAPPGVHKDTEGKAGAGANTTPMELRSQKAKPVYGTLPVESLLLMVVRLVVA